MKDSYVRQLPRPNVSLGVKKTVCVPGPDGGKWGKDGGQRSYQSPLHRETGASRLAKVSGLHIHTHTYCPDVSATAD